MRNSVHKKASKLELEEKRRKRNVQIMSVVIIFIMTSSLFAYAFYYTGNSPQNSVEEYDQTFRIVNVEGQQVWQATFGDAEPYFFALPSQVEGYYTEDEALALYLDSDVMSLSFDPLEMDTQISQILLSQFYDVSQTKLLSYGVTQPSPAYPNASIITCDNAEQFAPVLYMGLTNVTNETGILLEDNCIKVQAFNPQDLFFMTEKLRYVHYGIDFSTPVLE